MDNLFKKLAMTTGKLKNTISEKFKVEDLTHTEVVTLNFIVKRSECTIHKDEINVKTIQEFFKIKVSSVVQLLNKLENKKLIERKSSKLDKRISIIEPTDRAKKLIDTLYEESERVLFSIIDDKEKVNEALDVLLDLNMKLSSKKAIQIKLKEEDDE